MIKQAKAFIAQISFWLQGSQRGQTVCSSLCALQFILFK